MAAIVIAPSTTRSKRFVWILALCGAVLAGFLAANAIDVVKVHSEEVDRYYGVHILGVEVHRYPENVENTSLFRFPEVNASTFRLCLVIAAVYFGGGAGGLVGKILDRRPTKDGLEIL